MERDRCRIMAAEAHRATRVGGVDPKGSGTTLGWQSDRGAPGVDLHVGGGHGDPENAE